MGQKQVRAAAFFIAIGIGILSALLPESSSREKNENKEKR
jgi:hypothetical protein